MKDLDIDKIYTDFVLKHVKIFQHIHPNLITVSGICLNFVILYLLLNGSVYLTWIALFLRWNADVLDGAVARMYGKVSDLGGALDTTSDNLLICILGFWFSGFWIVGVALASANLAYMYFKDSLLHHVDMKKGGNKVENVYAFFTNNTCLSYILICIAIGVL